MKLVLAWAFLHQLPLRQLVAPVHWTLLVLFVSLTSGVLIYHFYRRVRSHLGLEKAFKS
jgi:hypothetical protein